MRYEIRQKVRNCFVSHKKIVIIALSIIVGITTFALNIHQISHILFSNDNIVYKTTYINPDPENSIYPLYILSDGEVLPEGHQWYSESVYEEREGPNNIAFTVTNNTDREFLIDEIKATLIEYEILPEKCIHTVGAMYTLVPVDLSLILNPSQSDYILATEDYLVIPSGSTGHIFRVYVAGAEPGLYRFKIFLKGWLGGDTNVVAQSDTTYSFVIPPIECPECVFWYQADPTDQHFQELVQIARSPMDEFQQITSDWGEGKMFDNIHRAPVSVREFMGIHDPLKKANIQYEETSPTLTWKSSSELVLTAEDLASVVINTEDGSRGVWTAEELPDWVTQSKFMNRVDDAISVCSVKYIGGHRGIGVVYNTTAIYPDIESANAACLKLQQVGNGWSIYTYKNINVGDHYFLINGQSVSNMMNIFVFQKDNVVVTIVCTVSTGYGEYYAQIVEDKI